MSEKVHLELINIFLKIKLKFHNCPPPKFLGKCCNPSFCEIAILSSHKKFKQSLHVILRFLWKKKVVNCISHILPHRQTFSYEDLKFMHRYLTDRISLTFTAPNFPSSLNKKMLRATQMIRRRIPTVIMLQVFF